MSSLVENLPERQQLQPDQAEPTQICFNYTGTDKLDRSVSFYLYADDESHARAILEHAGISDVEVTPRKQRAGWRRKKVTRRDIGMLALALAERTKANQKMSYAVAELARLSTHPVLRSALYDVKNALKHDVDKPADAFRKREEVFSRSFCKMVEIATSENNTGDPSQMLLEYGDAQIKTAENISRMIGATIYPGIVLALASVIVFFMCYFIMPSMEDMYRGLLETTQAELPLPTQILVGFSNFITSWLGMLTIILIIAGGFLVFRKIKSDEGSQYFQRKLLYWPLVGPLLRTFHAAYTIHLIAILGEVITPKEFLKEIAGASLNIVYQENLLSIRKALVEGSLKLETAFEPYAFLFGDDFHATLTTAEEAGDLDQINRYAKMLDKQVEEKVAAISKIIEPLTMIIAGVVIFMILLSFYLPMFTLVGKLAHQG